MTGIHPSTKPGRMGGQDRIISAIRVPAALFTLFAFSSIVYAAGPPEWPAERSAWPQFRGDPALTGVASSSLPASLELKWSFDFGEAVESSAAIVDGVVYAASQSGELVALNLTDGAVRWRYRDAESIGESSPAVADGVVYIADLAGVIHAVDAVTGKARWTFKTASEIKASPTVVGDRVLVGSYDERLYALSARDGTVLWSARTEGPVHSTAAVRDGIAYVSGCDEVFRAFRVSDGEQLFEIHVGAYTGASPALAGGKAFFGTFNNEVLSVDLRDRSVDWRYSHPQRSFPFYASAAVTEGKVVVGGRDRLIHCLDASNGEALWTYATRARVESSPAISGGRVYAGSNDGRLYALDLADGTKVWEFHAGAAITASPAIAEGRLVVGDFEGRLYCFG